MMAEDEIKKLEVEALRRTQAGDWSGARQYFEQALTFAMPPLRQAQILRNVAGTHMKQGNRQGAVTTADRAIAILDSAEVSAEELRNELHNISTFSGGQLPLSTFWYSVVFLAGLYWGVSVASGAPMDPRLVYVGPPLLCLLTASIALGGLNSRTMLGAITLYAGFLFAFAIGYAIAAAGLLRFGYRQT